jgi:cytochrome P450/NADPH-cytochrome P450 reductase
MAATAVPGRSGGEAAAGNARKAAFSGIAFAVLFTLALVLVNQIPRLDSPDSTYAAFYSAGSGGVLVTVGMYLVPFAGIAFLWFMMAFRALLDHPADLTLGLQLASGVAFIIMLFAGTAAAGAVALMLHFASVPAPPVSVDRVLSSVGYGLVFVYGVRVAGMFTITTATLARKAGLIPRWLAILSYLMAAFLLFTTTTQPATLLVYPAWVLLLSIALVRSGRARSGAALAAGRFRPHQSAPKHTPGGVPMTTSPDAPPPAAGGAAADVIPGPRPRPVVGNVLDLDRKHAVEGAIRLAREYGPIYRLTVPGGDRYVVSGSDLVEEVCDQQRFDKLITGGLSEVRRDPENTGLFTSDTDNPLWRRAHNILLPSFSQQAMRDYHPMMLDMADQLMLKWARLNNDDEIDVAADMTRLTLDTIALCGFDYRFNSFYRDTPHPFVAAMVRTLEESQTRSRELPIQGRLRVRAARKLAADQAFMDQMVDDIVRERKESGAGEGQRDLLSCMLEGVDKQSGDRLPDVNIRAQCITFLVAGHETTSGLLTFAIYFLLKHPEVMARATAEVDDVLGTDTGVLPSYAQVRKLGYVTQILDEALRLWPTAPGFTRSPFEDTVIGGRYPLPKGAAVLVLTPMLHRDPKVWGTDAEEFNPDHFSPERRAALPPNAYKPFGDGQRACIGRQFAMQEATLVLGMLLQRFDLIDHRSYDLEIREALTIKPDGLRIKVRARPGRVAGGDGSSAPALVPDAPVLPESALAGSALPESALAAAVPRQARRDGHNTPLMVLFGSNLGTAEGIATRLAREGSDRGFAVTLGSLDEHRGGLPREGAAVIVTASYNGTPPDNAARFCSWIQDPATPADACADLRYSVFGCGSTDWAATYQAIPKLIDTELEARGATRVYPRGEGDAAADFDEQYAQWHAGLWPALAAGLSLPDDVVAAAAGERRLMISLVNRQTANPVVKSYQAQPALIEVNRELQSSDGPEPPERSTRHIEISLPPGTSYETGDHLGVLPRNDVGLIQRVIRHFKLDAGMYMVITADGGTPTHLPVAEPTPLLGVLACCVELQDVASREDIALMAGYTEDGQQRQELQALASADGNGQAGYREAILRPHRSLIDLLEAFPTCTMPFEVYLDRLPPLHPRYYSISSSARVSPDVCSVTVGVLQGPAPSGDGLFTGVCSGYLDRSPGRSTVFAFVRKPSIPFRPPDNPHIPMIMVGCGTGLAPFRGFIQERADLKVSGVPVAESMLFFGFRRPSQDYLYEQELRDFEAMGAVRLIGAASRVPGQPKKYVQHCILEQRADVWRLIEAGAVIFVCGNAGTMAPDVRRAFTDVFREQTGRSQADADAWLTGLRAEHRYLEDIWGGSAAPADGMPSEAVAAQSPPAPAVPR